MSLFFNMYHKFQSVIYDIKLFLPCNALQSFVVHSSANAVYDIGVHVPWSYEFFENKYS